MNALAAAIEERDWDRAARLLLISMSRTAERLSPETLEALLDLLSVPPRREGRHDR